MTTKELRSMNTQAKGGAHCNELPTTTATARGLSPNISGDEDGETSHCFHGRILKWYSYFGEKFSSFSKAKY